MTSEAKTFLREPIPEIFAAARLLDEAVAAHLAGDRLGAEELIRAADISAVHEWSEALWGKGAPYYSPLPVENPAPFVPKDQRVKPRMANAQMKRALLVRDGFHCRFCGIPLVRGATRSRIRAAYPAALRWGSRNVERHAAFQTMELHYDHIVPHARGGTNEFDNMLVTCAPCNCGRDRLMLEEVGLADPRARAPIRSEWDGLERFREGN